MWTRYIRIALTVFQAPPRNLLKRIPVSQLLVVPKGASNIWFTAHKPVKTSCNLKCRAINRVQVHVSFRCFLKTLKLDPAATAVPADNKFGIPEDYKFESDALEDFDQLVIIHIIQRSSLMSFSIWSLLPKSFPVKWRNGKKAWWLWSANWRNPGILWNSF